MRFYLKDSERRPDPQPVATDDRKAVITGLAGWLVTLAVVLVLAVMRGAEDGAVIGTCVAGTVLGVALLLYTQRRRRRS